MKNVAFLLFLCIFVLFVAFIVVTEDIQLLPDNGESVESSEVEEENIIDSEDSDDLTEDTTESDSNDYQGENTQAPVPANYSPESRQGVVEIGSIRKRDSSSSHRYIDLEVNLNEGEFLNLTGWQIFSNTDSITIPQAVNFFDITNTENNIETDIIVRDSHNVRIYLVDEDYYEDYEYQEKKITKDPDVDWYDLWKGNLRLNTCTGYLNELYETVPELPNDCPSPERSTYIHFPGDCQNYIRRVDSCELPEPSDVYSFRGEGVTACRVFIFDFFSPEGCFAENVGNPDFLKNEWMIWIEKDDLFDELHDRILILNRNGEMIDEYIY